MQFNSYIFILAFLPLFVIGYHLLCKLHQQAGKFWIIAAGAVFYCYHGWSAAAVLGSSILVNLILALLTQKYKKKWILVLTVVLNILLLFYYKYFNFGITITNDLFHTSYALREIIMPLGISFFTFQQIMYVLAVYRSELQKVSIPDYLAYILYFPKLIMGPLAEPADLIRQINDPAQKKADWQNIAGGLKLFACGLFKKMVLADTFSHAVTWGFSNIEAATSGDFFLVMLFYTFEIYFDFSGYTDMATGVSMMVNITLPMNFDSPYKALSIRDFWKRWHISLTAFFTKNVYIPLGGSHKGIIRTWLNILIVFLVSGLWHGANWTFLLWGGLHGILQILERTFDKTRSKLMEAVRWFLTFACVNVLWLLFRADSIHQWTSLLWKMFSFQNLYISDGLIETFVLPEHSFFMDLFHLHSFDAGIRGLSMVFFIAGAFILCLIPENCYRSRHRLNPANLILCAIAFIWGFLCLSSESVFVYFNF